MNLRKSKELIGGKLKMSQKTQEMISLDCVELNNQLVNDLCLEDVQVDLNEIDMSLKSQDLLMMDATNLLILDDTKYFSEELLEMIRSSKVIDFEERQAARKAISLEAKLAKIQHDVITVLNKPLNEMFDEFANIIIEKIA